MLGLDIDLSPTQDAFVYSDANINWLISNTGEGKTYACILSLMEHAALIGKPLAAAIVRDTHQNIKGSIVRSIMEFFEDNPKAYRFADDFKRLTIYSKPRVDCDLFGIDDLGDLSKLQGPQYGLIWLNEPAPISGTLIANAGLSEEVFKVALVRCSRQKGAPARLNIDMNPAEMDHWTYRWAFEEPDIDPRFPDIRKAVYRIIPGENAHVSAQSRQAVQMAYQHDVSGYTRFVLGDFAPVYKGKKVAMSYNPHIHLSAIGLEPAPGLDGFMFYDGWHNPVCHLGQITGTGRMVFIDTVRMDGAAVEQLIDYKVRPLVESPRWKDKCRTWRAGGDISMEDADQSSKVRSAARTISDAFEIPFEPGPKRWERIYAGMNKGFSYNILGRPAIVINRDNRVLHRCLDGGWHFKTDPSGNVPKGAKPEKDEMSHVGDAYANAVCVMLPVFDTKFDKKVYMKAIERQKNRAAGYGGAAYG